MWKELPGKSGLVLFCYQAGFFSTGCEGIIFDEIHEKAQETLFWFIEGKKYFDLLKVTPWALNKPCNMIRRQEVNCDVVLSIVMFALHFGNLLNAVASFCITYKIPKYYEYCPVVTVYLLI